MPLKKVACYYTGDPAGTLTIQNGKVVATGIQNLPDQVTLSRELAMSADKWFPVDPALSSMPADSEGYIVVPVTNAEAFLKAYAATHNGGYSSVEVE